jgi:hypothetical protein
VQSAHACLRVQLDRERFHDYVERQAVRVILGSAHLEKALLIHAVAGVAPVERRRRLYQRATKLQIDCGRGSTLAASIRFKRAP